MGCLYNSSNQGTGGCAQEKSECASYVLTSSASELQVIDKSTAVLAGQATQVTD